MTRRILMQSKDSVSIPYITDGLVCMYDCDSYSGGTKWKSLVGNIVLSGEPNQKSEDGGVIMANAFSNSAYENVSFLEICFKPNVKNIGVMVTIGLMRFVCTEADGWRMYVDLQNGWVYWLNTIKQTFSANANIAFKNKNKLTTKKNNRMQFDKMTLLNSMNGTLYCVRGYSRELTESEILHNQQIDNERFNLGLA